MTFKLPKTYAAWRAHIDVHDVLEKELAAIAPELALVACTHTGGWPEDEELAVRSVEDRDGRLKIEVLLTFTESIPSSCKDMPYTHPRQNVHVLILDESDDVAFLDRRPSDPDQFDLADWNSAGDDS